MKVPAVVHRCVGVGITAVFWALRFTFRLRVHNDPRFSICKQTGRHYVFAILHAHQLAALTLSQSGTGAMVSRSRDGELLMPLLRGCGCVPIRGSSGTGSKGGSTALSQLIRHVRAGNPAVIAVDGPRGPRGTVQRGIAMLAQKADVPIVPVVLIPRQRWIFQKTWDRLQVLMPFCQVDCRFGDPIYPSADQSIEDLTDRTAASLKALEIDMDPGEAICCDEAAEIIAAAKRARRSERAASVGGDAVSRQAA